MTTTTKKQPAKKPVKKTDKRKAYTGAKHTTKKQVRAVKAEQVAEEESLSEMLGKNSDLYMGRRTSYTREIGAEICARIAQGQSLRAICREDHLPHKATVVRWALFSDDETVHKNPALRLLLTEFSEQYNIARILQAENFVDEVTDISDDTTNDYMMRKVGGIETEVPDNEVINRSKLRVETRKWLGDVYLPKIQALREKSLQVKGKGKGSLTIVFDQQDGEA